MTGVAAWPISTVHLFLMRMGEAAATLSVYMCNNAAVPAQQNNAAVPAQQNNAAFLAQQDRVQAVWRALQQRSASIAMLLSHIALHSQQDIMRVNVSAQKNTEHSFVQYSWTGYGGALQRVPSMIRVERERKKKESRVMWTLQSVNAFLLFQNKILRG